MPAWQSDQSDPLPKGKTDGAGLGLNIPVEELLGRPHERKTNTLPRASPAISLPKQPVRGQHYRRHWLSKNNDDCSNSTVSKAWTTAFYTLPSPRLASASATLTSAPTTPKLDSEMPSTPIITSSAVLTSSTSAATTYTFHQDGRDASNTASSSFKPNNTAVAVTAVSTAGSLLLLAGLFFALYLRRRRSKRDHQNKMTSVLDKVSSNPRNDPKSSDGRQMSEKWANCGRGAVDSNEYFIAAANQATTPASVSDAKKLKFISPWLVYDLGSHPFANAGRAQTGAERRFSPDLAHSGLVGQSPSKDQSFTWSFPKLSVPPAAARAIVTSHYIKKKRSMTLPPPPVCDSRSISSVDIQQAATNSSSPSSIGHRRSFLNMEDAKIRNVSTSASSDCVDPQVDHRRMSFTVKETVKDSKRWIRSALRCLESQKLRPEIVVENLDKSSCNSSPWLPTISSRRSTSLRSGSHSISFLSHTDDSATMQVEQITSTSRPGVGNVGVRLPSLSVVNNVMLDALDISSIPFPTPPVKGSPRLPSLKWARRSSGIDDEASKIQSGMTTTAVRSFSNESYQPHIAPPTRIVTRRVSWAGLLEACREDSKENMAAMSHEAESATLPLANSEIATNTMLIRRPCDWGNALLLPADTEDEGSNGYEAEQEVDTEVETDDSRGRVYVPPSTPVITLTCSEEEGNLERRISLTSARRESSSESSHQACQAAQHEVDDDDEDATLFDRDAVDLTNSSGDELTVILNSFDSSIGSESSGNEDDDDNGDDGGALHCLLHDDFPTIPQWTPIPSALRNR